MAASQLGQSRFQDGVKLRSAPLLDRHLHHRQKEGYVADLLGQVLEVLPAG